MKNVCVKLLSAVMIFSMLFSINPVEAFGESGNNNWKSTTKTVTEGDFTIVTTTLTRSEAGTFEKEIYKYVTDNTANETILYTTLTYDNGSTGVSVVCDTERTKVNSREEGEVTGNIEGSYDVTRYIKKHGEDFVTMDVKTEFVDKLFDSIYAFENRQRKDAVITETVTLESKLENINSFTFNIPKKIIKNIYEKNNAELKVKGPFGFAKFDRDAMKKMLEDSEENILITLNKFGSDGSTGMRITVNNGTQLKTLESENCEAGVYYEGAYMLDASRVSITHTDSFGIEKKQTEGIKYNNSEHMVTFTNTDVGEYEVNVAPVKFSDTENHWAEEAVSRWSDMGIIVGYNGNFSPNSNIKRCDMATIVGRLTNEPPQQMERPKEYITREEAAELICKAFGYEKSGTCSVSFSDTSDVAENTKGYLYTLVNKGYMKGYNGKVNPKAPITRAEAVTMFSNIVAELVNFGTFEKEVKGNVLVNGDGVQLKNTVIDGDVIISDGVGDGDVTLENVKVTGCLIVRGGGENSIHINGDSDINEVDVKRTTGTVRIVAEKGTEVKDVNISDGLDGIILEGEMTSVKVNTNVPVRMTGLTLEEMKVLAENAKITVDSMSHIENASIEEEASKTALDVSGEVKKIAAKGEGTAIEGTGAVNEVVAAAEKITVKTSGTKVTVNEGITGTIAGKESLKGGQTGNVPGKIPGISSNGKVSESVSVFAPDIKVKNLENGKTYKNGKLTFDLYATSTKGKKLSASSCKVTLNGAEVKKAWDDDVKTSYTLNFEEGSNTIVVEATDDGETSKKTFDVKFEAGTCEAVVAVELFSLGEGYLIYPTTVEFEDGDTAADVLLKLLDENGFTYKYTGKPTANFYLAHICGSSLNELPMNMDSIPEYMKTALKKSGYAFDTRSSKDSLGEFDYTNGSGWMYSVRNSFPNVGFSEYYLQDGDVMRVQFTLALGADLGEDYGGSGCFWTVVDRDAVTKKYADKDMPESVVEKIQQLDAKSI